MSAAVQEHGAAAADHGASGSEGFNAGETIIHHIANNAEHPVIHLPKLFGIDFSITKHVFMLWLVAFIVFVVITWIVRRYLKHGPVPSGAGNALELIVEFVRDTIVQPNVGEKWVKTWAPLILTFFAFIFTANLIGLIPIFEVLNLLNHWVFHAGPDTFYSRLLHGGTTATANFNVTAGLALVTFFSIIVAGTKAHGFLQHWKNIVPHGLAWPIYILLIPIEILGMLVKPFALTMRLAANMTGGHIAILAVLSLVFLFKEMAQNAFAGIAVGVFVSVPLALGISGLELIVVLVQAYVFTLLSAVFIGMVIHVHH
ncbi:MAG: F0F1 ATP synthase subunit A [Acidobacteriota bacterium]